MSKTNKDVAPNIPFPADPNPIVQLRKMLDILQNAVDEKLLQCDNLTMAELDLLINIMERLFELRLRLYEVPNSVYRNILLSKQLKENGETGNVLNMDRFLGL